MAHHIMIVDDDPDIRNIVKHLLQGEGYRITQAENGVECLACFRKDPADLIVLDLVMPEKEGLETLEELRQIAPEVKIVVVSGGLSTGQSFLKVAKLMGADATMAKPMDTSKLLTTVAELLN